MNVVGHQDPSQQPIALSVEVQEAVFDLLCNAGPSEKAGSVADIQVAFPLEEAVQGVRIRIKPFPHEARENVRKPKRDELHGVRAVEMGQVAT